MNLKDRLRSLQPLSMRCPWMETIGSDDKARGNARIQALSVTTILNTGGSVEFVHVSYVLFVVGDASLQPSNKASILHRRAPKAKISKNQV